MPVGMPGILSVIPTWCMKTVLGLEPTSVHSHTETYTEIYNHRLTDMTSHPGTRCPYTHYPCLAEWVSFTHSAGMLPP